MSDESKEVPRGRPFAPGQSGNPSGRPKGARNRSTVLAQAFLDDTAEAFLAKAKAMALDGDRTMLPLFVKQILPRERPLPFDLRDVRTADDIAELTQSLVERVADGEISLHDAERVGELVRLHLNALEQRDFEERIRVLELYMEQQG